MHPRRRAHRDRPAARGQCGDRGADRRRADQVRDAQGRPGALMVDRFLYTAMRYPGNYGFIPHTLSGDGDPCDVMVANTRAIVPGAIMSCRIVGVLMMEDEAGGDEKLIAVPAPQAHPALRPASTTTPTCRTSRVSRSSTSSPTTRTWNPANGSRSCAGATPRRPRRLVLEGIERAKGARGDSSL